MPSVRCVPFGNQTWLAGKSISDFLMKTSIDDFPAMWLIAGGCSEIMALGDAHGVRPCAVDVIGDRDTSTQSRPAGSLNSRFAVQLPEISLELSC